MSEQKSLTQQLKSFAGDAANKLSQAYQWSSRNASSNTLGNWISHGATELANMVLHGHPAPVYSNSYSPPNTSTIESVTAKDAAVPDKGNAIQATALNKADVTQSKISPPTVAQEGPSVHGQQSPAVGLLQKHMDDLHARPELTLSEPELSR